ncbi:hypothetical protein CQA65_30675, partial [Klebsiella pneumoniae]
MVAAQVQSDGLSGVSEFTREGSARLGRQQQTWVRLPLRPRRIGRRPG